MNLRSTPSKEGGWVGLVFKSHRFEILETDVKASQWSESYAKVVEAQDEARGQVLEEAGNLDIHTELSLHPGRHKIRIVLDPNGAAKEKNKLNDIHEGEVLAITSGSR